MSANKLTHRYGYITWITCFQRSSKYNLCMCTILVAFFNLNILCIIFHWSCVVTADSMTILQSITNIFFYFVFIFLFSSLNDYVYKLLHHSIISFAYCHRQFYFGSCFSFFFFFVIKLQISEEFMKKKKQTANLSIIQICQKI